jgi:hypothetical protein
VHASLRAEPKVRRFPLSHPSLRLPGPRSTFADRLYSSVASIRLSTMLSLSTCRFLRMSRLHPRASAPATPLPPSNDPSPAAPSASPGHSPLAPASYNPSSKRSTRPQNTHAAYNELVASATSTTSHPHPPPRSRPCPAPGHHDHATQVLATRRARSISTNIRFFGDYFPHTPACNARPAHFPAPSQRGLDAHPHNYVVRKVFTFCRHSAQSPLSLCFRRAQRQPQGISRPNRELSESHYQLSMPHPPSICLSRTTYASLLRLPCRILSLLNSHFICVVVSNVFGPYFGPYTVLNE